MSPLFPIACAIVLFLVSPAFGAKPTGQIWTDPKKAEAEDPDYTVQGEYVGKSIGVQVVALGKGRFYVSTFKGGLPGAGWDKSAPVVASTDQAGVLAATKGMEKAERTSPTGGRKAPAGADVLVGDKVDATLVKGGEKDGYLWAGAQTVKEYGDFTMHLEFRLPYKPLAAVTSQDRGNSGIYLQNRYEVQVLDSFGLVYDREQVKLPIKSDPKQWCGCFYKFKTADTPMCLPPLKWQTYDIEFTAPKFDGAGVKTSNATITVAHNGVKIHDAVKLPKGTGAGGGRKEVPEGPIVFQGHGNPVAFRNVWILEK